MRKYVVIGALAAVLFGLFPSPAKADPHAGAMACTVNFPSFPGNGSTSCNGTFVGADVGGVDVTCAVGCPFSLQMDNYADTCVFGDVTGSSDIGTANGRIVINGEDVGNFNYLRIGVAVLMVPPDTAAVFAFAPVSWPFTCESPSPLTAVLAGPIGVL